MIQRAAVKHKSFAPLVIDSHFQAFVVDEEVLDEVIALWFPGPNSYTGEEVVELSFHGSAYILDSALDRLVQAGAQLAKPGEFTQRAFFNGKLDLSQAEAIADLISSTTEASHKLAMQQMSASKSLTTQMRSSAVITFLPNLTMYGCSNMNDLFEIVEDLEALDAKVESLQALINKWSAKVDAAEADMEQLYEMDDGA